MLSLFAQGLGVGFLGILVSHQAVFDQATGYAGAAAAAGALLALLPGHRFSVQAAPGKGTRAFLAGGGIVAGIGLIAARFASGIWAAEEVALLFLGLATGGCLRLTLALLLPMLPARQSASLLGLAGVSFGLGGLTANAVGVVAVILSAANSLHYWAAIVPALLAFAAVRAGQLRFDEVGASRSRMRIAHNTSPRSVLMAASFAFQAATCLTAACWLTVHLLRGVGLSGAFGATVLTAFWAAFCVGWAFTRRMPRIRENLAALSVPLALGVPGSVFLLVGWQHGVGLGAALLGLGIGTLFPLTLGLSHWPSVLGRCRWISRSLHLSLPVGLLAGCVAGTVAFAAGSGALVWAILGWFLLAVATLIVLVADYRVSGDPALI